MQWFFILVHLSKKVLKESKFLSILYRQGLEQYKKAWRISYCIALIDAILLVYKYLFCKVFFKYFQLSKNLRNFASRYMQVAYINELPAILTNIPQNKMSYDISLYRIETKEKEEKSKDENFFENKENLVPFTSKQIQEIKERLMQYDYELCNEDDLGLYFTHQNEDYGTALLTKEVLYFTASFNKNSIFEVGMTASEFTDTGGYAKYDFQNREWEIWE